MLLSQINQTLACCEDSLLLGGCTKEDHDTNLKYPKITGFVSSGIVRQLTVLKGLDVTL